MAPNAHDSVTIGNIENIGDRSKVGSEISPSSEVSTGKYIFLIAHGTANLVAYILIGFIVAINMVFAVRFGLPLNPVNTHIILCVIGYQLLMGAAFLVLTPESGFHSRISLRDRRLIHTFLMIAGSALAITGSFIMTLAKPRANNFNTIHGKTSLVAKAFSIACLFNGLTSLYAYELRKCLPSKLSKLTHILFGVLAFVFANVSLAYGFHKNSFRNWSTHEFTATVIIFTGIMTLIIVLNPIYTFFTKLSNSGKE